MWLQTEHLRVIGTLQQLQVLEVSYAAPAASMVTWRLRRRLDGQPVVMKPQLFDALLSCSTQLTRLAWCGPQVRLHLSSTRWEMT